MASRRRLSTIFNEALKAYPHLPRYGERDGLCGYFSIYGGNLQEIDRAHDHIAQLMNHHGGYVSDWVKRKDFPTYLAISSMPNGWYQYRIEWLKRIVADLRAQGK